MLQPKKTKFRKAQKGRMKGLSQRGHRLSDGMFGIKSLDSKFITSRQIEAARIAATRYMKREGQLWIKIFPDKPITKKPLEVRMGKGKGAPEYFVAVVRPGRILFEVAGVFVDVFSRVFFEGLFEAFRVTSGAFFDTSFDVFWSTFSMLFRASKMRVPEDDGKQLLLIGVASVDF